MTRKAAIREYPVKVPDKDRIAMIIALEGRADLDRDARSAQRWAAARLIWEELQHKSYVALSEEIKSQGGKGSIGHLIRMNRCWELTVVRPGIEPHSYEDLPFFGEVYQCEEVRNPANRKRRNVQASQARQRRARKACLHESAPSWVAAANEALDSLAEHRVAWPFLSDGDLDVLKGIPAKAENILSMLRDRKASA